VIEEALPRFLGKREILAWARDTLVNQHQESPAHLRALAAQSRWAEMARITHALRGAAANIGAIDLARQARLLEESLDLRDMSVIHPLIESLRIALEKLSQRSTPDPHI
jgi:HPt (histidine-containing phosphotransfer) domain-containing protein